MKKITKINKIGAEMVKMNSKMRNEDSKNQTFRLSKKHFQDQLLEILIVAMKPEFHEKYHASEKRLDFICLAEEAFNKIKMISNRTTSNEEKEALIETLKQELPRLIRQLSDESLSMQTLLDCETHKASHALLKWVSLYVKELIEMVKNNKPEDIQDWIDEQLSSKDDILCYLGLSYVHVHMRTFKLPKTKENWLLSATKLYTSTYPIFQSMNDANEQLATLKEHNAELVKVVSKKDKAIESKKNESIVLNEKIKVLGQKLQQKEKQSVSKKIEGLTVSLDLEKKKVEASEKSQLALQIKFEKLGKESVSKAIYERHQSELEALKVQNQQLLCKRDEAVESEKSWREYHLMPELEAYLQKNGMTETLSRLLAPYMGQEIAPLLPEMSISNPDVCYFGYCDVNDHGHFVVDVDENRRLITEIPEDLYLGQGQFVLVDGHGGLIESYFNRYKPNEFAGNVTEFAILDELDGILEVLSANEDRYAFKNLTPNTLVKGRVVGLNAKQEIIQSYCPIKFNADFFLKSARIRYQQVFMVEKVIEMGILVKDIGTSVSKFITLENLEAVNPYCLIFVKEDKLVKRFEHARFYTSSSLYEDTEKGSVIVDEKGIFFQKLNGELRLVGLIPERVALSFGDVICVDEFINFIEKKSDREFDVLATENPSTIKRNRNATANGVDLEDEEENAVLEMRPEQILIIGDD